MCEVLVAAIQLDDRDFGKFLRERQDSEWLLATNAKWRSEEEG